MLPSLSKPHFSSHTKAIHVASTAEKEDQFSSAVAFLRKHAKDDEIIDIHAICDGAWSKCGQQAIYGVVLLLLGRRARLLIQRYSASTVLGVKHREERTHPPNSSWIGIRNTKDSVT